MDPRDRQLSMQACAEIPQRPQRDGFSQRSTSTSVQKIQVQQEVTEDFLQQRRMYVEDDLKHNLCKQLVEEIRKKNVIEWGKYKDASTEDLIKAVENTFPERLL
jgi:hypothetical protein